MWNAANKIEWVKSIKFNWTLIDNIKYNNAAIDKADKIRKEHHHKFTHYFENKIKKIATSKIIIVQINKSRFQTIKSYDTILSEKIEFKLIDKWLAVNWHSSAVTAQSIQLKYS